MRHTAIVLLVLGLLLLSTLACTITLPSVRTGVGELRQQSVQVPLGQASAAVLDIAFGAGEFRLAPGTGEGFLQADFTYNVDELEPVVREDHQGDRLEVDLSLNAAGLPLNLGDETRNEWDVRVSQEVPIALDLDLGAAEGRVDLGGLRLTDVHLRTGAADVEVDWSEPNPESLEVLDVEAGAASLRMRRLGNAQFEWMRFTGGAGNFDLDFSGDWQEPAEIDIDASLSNLTLTVPEEVGVQIDAGDRPLTNVDTRGFRREGDTWVNDAWGTSEVKLVFSVNIGLGNLTLVSQ
jgi:hypothetical protein